MAFITDEKDLKMMWVCVGVYMFGWINKSES